MSTVAPPRVRAVAEPRLRGARRVAAVQGVLVLASVALTLCASTVPAAWGWQPRVVISGSMQPSISAGDVVLVERVDAGSLRPGKVVLADTPGSRGHTYLHRIVSIDKGKIVTRGDANQTNDFPALGPRSVLGEARLVVPLIGWPMLWLQQRTVPMLLAALSSLVVLVAAVVAVTPLWEQPRGGPGRRRATRARRGRRGHSDGGGSTRLG